MSMYHPSSPAWEKVKGSPSMKAQLQEGAWRQEHDADVVLHSMTLPFYPGYRLIMATCVHWKPESTALYWLVGADKIYRLNGVSPPIHEANALIGQRITEATALAYLTFFCFFVRGEEGPFAIVGSLDDPYLPTALQHARDPYCETTEERRLLALRYQSPRYHGTTDGGEIRYSALVFYSNAMFTADLLVHPGGMVDMKDDIPVMAELSCRVDAPLTLSPEFQP